MCLAIPMKLIKIDGEEGTLEAADLKKKANLSLMKGLKPGDYVLIHAGFAIEKVKEEEAKKTLQALADI